MPSDRSLSRFSMAIPDSWLRASGKLNVPLYRLSRGRLMGKVGTAPVLLLTTTGRRSRPVAHGPGAVPRRRRTADRDRIQRRQRPRPAWSFNLKANPDAEVEVRGKRGCPRRVADGEERAELWRRMNAQYEGFDPYDAQTSRQIPVFVLEPR